MAVISPEELDGAYADVNVKVRTQNADVVQAEQLPEGWEPSESLRDLVGEVVERTYDGSRARRFFRLVGRCRGAGLTQGQTVTYLTPWCEANDKFVGRVGDQVAACWNQVDEAMTIKFPEPSQPTGDGMELDEFLDEDEPDYDWLIPNLMEREERLILTGGEGNGKSTLMRQIGVQCASGIHPVTREPMAAIAVLQIDLENPKRIVKRKMRELRTIAGPSYVKGKLTIISKPEGLAIDTKDGAQWLSAQLFRYKPELLIIGPLYKMTDEELSENKPSKAIASMLDKIRTHYHCSLIIEAHMRHAVPGQPRPTRPYGASLWLRWPEFGLYLSPSGELKHWRTPRDKRPWPETLSRGNVANGDWPWMVEGDSGNAGVADSLRRITNAENALVSIVGDNPGINTKDLTTQLSQLTGISAASELSRIILDAVKSERIIRRTGARNAQHHFLPDMENLAS